MPIVEVEGQQFEFPEGTTDEIIGNAIRQHFATQERIAGQPSPEIPGQLAPADAARVDDRVQMEAEVEARMAPEAEQPFAPGRARQQQRARGREATQRVQSEREAALAALPPERRALLESISPIEAGLIGMGKGFSTIGRAVGLMDPETQFEEEAFGQLQEQQPIATTTGEILGEAAPFVAPGLGIAAIPSRAAQVAGVVGLGATEAGLIMRGRGEDIGTQLQAAGIGGTIAGAMDLALPVIGRIGGKIVRRMTGKAPTGAVIDELGNPSEELTAALQKEGLSYDDLIGETIETLKSQKAGSSPEQLARMARASEEGIRLTKGELTQEFGQQATEQRLLESASDPVAERFRQFHLARSQTIRENLEQAIDTGKMREETGSLITEALSGRKKLLRTAKNDLYQEAADNAKEIGGVPLFTDTMEDMIPDQDLLEDIAITSPASVDSLNKLLAKWGFKPDGLPEGVTPTQMTIQNFERFRKSLNAIERGDPTFAISNITKPLKNALDDEVSNLADVLARKGVRGEVVKPLMEARKTVRQIKTEFSPQAFTGRLVDVKRDGVTPIVEASQVYSKISSKAQPVENVRKLMNSLHAAGPKGRQAIGDLQSSVMLDLIDSGFGTASRKIDGIPVFNPGAFKKRIKTIGADKLQTIFKNNKQVLKNIHNIDRIATDLIPTGGAVPKGSASVILDLMNRLGVISISSKLPGGPVLVESMRRMAESGKTRAAVETAINASPDIVPVSKMLDDTFPGISKALNIQDLRTAVTAPTAAVVATQQEGQQ